MTVDWYRNTDWDADIADIFYCKLNKAQPKNRPQYLSIQAQTLAQNSPQQALRLLESFFKSPIELRKSETLVALIVKGKLLLRSDRIGDGIKALEDACILESETKNVTAGAWLELGFAIAEHNLVCHFEQGLEALRCDDAATAIFPVQQFKKCSAAAIFHQKLGNTDKAIRLANIAITAAQTTDTSIGHYKNLGLVGTQYPKILKRLYWISSAIYPFWKRVWIYRQKLP